MDWIRIPLSRFAALFRHRNLDADLDEELRAHIDLAITDNLQRGMSTQEARTAALRAFGGVTQTRESYRIQRGLPFLEQFARDLQFAFRQLRRAPGFTLTAVVTLALSIGTNTAIFSIVNALMLSSLPYSEPDRIGTIFMHVQGSAAFDGRQDIDGEQWELLRDDVPSLVSAVSSGISSGVNLQAGQSVQYVHAGRVSAHYFDVLGIHPAIGRGFTEIEDRPHGPRTVVLSYRLWRATFHADPNLIGRAIELRGESYTVVGVLPAGARIPLNADIYTALEPSRQGEGRGTNFDTIVRLRDGARWRQVDAEINRVWANRALRFAKEYPPGATVTFYTVPLQEGQTAELIVRTAGPIEGLTGLMQRALTSVDPGLPFSGFYSMNDHLAETLAAQRVEVALLGAMAGLALLLSAIGIFALVASIVAPANPRNRHPHRSRLEHPPGHGSHRRVGNPRARIWIHPGLDSVCRSVEGSAQRALWGWRL